MQVNQYPTERSFKAIGMGGQDFVDSMVGAVEAAVGSQVQRGRVQQRPSAKGKYVSVTIGPVLIETSDQVHAGCTATCLSGSIRVRSHARVLPTGIGNHRQHNTGWVCSIAAVIFENVWVPHMLYAGREGVFRDARGPTPEVVGSRCVSNASKLLSINSHTH